MTYLEEYRDLIKRREIIVGEWIEKAVDLYWEEMSNPAYIYDTTEAHKRFKFQRPCACRANSRIICSPSN